MYKKITQVAVTVGVFLLALLAVAFSAYGLFQSTNVMKLLNFQAGYQQCVVDANKQIEQQKAEQQKINQENETTSNN